MTICLNSVPDSRKHEQRETFLHRPHVHWVSSLRHDIWKHYHHFSANELAEYPLSRHSEKHPRFHEDLQRAQRFVGKGSRLRNIDLLSHKGREHRTSFGLYSERHESRLVHSFEPNRSSRTPGLEIFLGTTIGENNRKLVENIVGTKAKNGITVNSMIKLETTSNDIFVIRCFEKVSIKGRRLTCFEFRQML